MIVVFVVGVFDFFVVVLLVLGVMFVTGCLI